MANLIEKSLKKDGVRIFLGVGIFLGVVFIGFGLYTFSLQPLDNLKVFGGLASIGIGIALLSGYKG